jgi:hypothetical protein
MNDPEAAEVKRKPSLHLSPMSGFPKTVIDATPDDD